MLKILSLRQPWAWMILHGKPIENRKWATTHRGEFAVHASKGMTREEYEDAREFARRAGMGHVPDRSELTFGGIIGMAEVADVIPPMRFFRSQFRMGADVHDVIRWMGKRGTTLTHRDLCWWMTEQCGFVLRNQRELPFIPWRGALGFFDATPALEQAIRGVLRDICPCSSELDDPGPTHLASCPYSDPRHDTETMW